MLVVLDLPTTVPVGTTLSCLHSVGAEAADRVSAEYPHTPILAQYHQRRGIAAARSLIHSVTLSLSLSLSASGDGGWVGNGERHRRLSG